MYRCICCGKFFMGPRPENPADLYRCPECRAQNKNICPPDPKKIAEKMAEQRRRKEEERRKQEEEERKRKEQLEQAKLLIIKQRKEELAKTFNGLKKVIPNYTKRKPQLEMAFGVREAILYEQIIAVEAGVGTGKTFAYLIPIFLEKEKFLGPVVISTKTINLQEQLVRDTENIKQLFEDKNTVVVLSKGKNNYCCRERFETFYSKFEEPKSEQEAAIKSVLEEIGSWLDGGGSDFSDENAPYIHEDLKDELAVGKCGLKCRYWRKNCTYSLMKSMRETYAEIIITNHNQLINDLRNRANSGKGLWKPPSLIVFDEAHALEDVARSELGINLSLNYLGKQLNKAKSNSHLSKYAESLEESYSAFSGVRKALEEQVERNKDLFDDSYSSDIRYPVKTDIQLIESFNRLKAAIDDLAYEIDIAYSATARTSKEYFIMEDLSDKFDDLSRTLERINLILKNPDGYVFWIEKSNRQKNYTFVTAPLDPSTFLKNNLWSKEIPVVLTSGTITVDDSFEHFQDKLGLKEKNIITQRHKSLFDYEHNVLIYVPRDIPEPPQQPMSAEDDEFTNAIALRCQELLSISKGRALILFTSYRRLHTVYNYLKKQDLGYQVLKQGDAGPGYLLKKFREDVSSILLATGAFWEGTDVAGEALSLLIIDKLPFPNHSDPLYQGLINRAKKKGLNPYEKVTLPTMLTMLHQGSGRLIRQEGDRGVVALLDKRAWRNNLHGLIKKHLPPAPWTDDLVSVANWFDEMKEIQ